MTTPKFIRAIPDVWKAAITVGSILAAGAVFSGHLGLPDRMDAAESAILTIQNELSGVREQMVLSNCMEIAERSSTDWRNCLNQ